MLSLGLIVVEFAACFCCALVFALPPLIYGMVVLADPHVVHAFRLRAAGVAREHVAAQVEKDMHWLRQGHTELPPRRA